MLNESLPNTLSAQEYNTTVNKYMKKFLEDKKTWIDQYGLERANFVMYKTAVKKAKEEFETKDNPEV
tara:strand:- start:699 stop:899 length:201 start_codon:yes stop_codon:yes gene_type:complete